MPRRAEHGDVSQLFAGFDASQHESTSAHVSATDEFGRKHKLRSEDAEQGIHIFGGRDAAQKYDLTVCVNPLGKESRVALEWHSIARVRRIQVAGSNSPQAIRRHQSIGRQKAAAGRNNE